MKLTIAILMSTHTQLGDTGKTTGTYASEVAHAVEVFDEAGVEILFVSPNGGAIPLYGTDHDARTEAFLADESWTTRLHASLSVAEASKRHVDAVYIAGGHGAMWDLAAPGAHADWMGSVWSSGRPLAAVCHGPAGLVSVTDAEGAPVVSGRKVAGFTNEEEDAAGLTAAMPFLLEDKLVALGGSHQGAPAWQAQVVRDGRLVTGQNPASADGVARALVALLKAERAD
jgi:putative intracellular protease/amidase